MHTHWLARHLFPIAVGEPPVVHSSPSEKAILHFMKPEYIYERRQSAGHMEVVMLLASFIGTVTAVPVFFVYGWLPGFALFLLSLIAYALSRVFDFLSDLLTSLEPGEQSPPVKDKNAA